MTNLRELCGDRYRVVDDGTDDSDRAERVWCQEIRGKYGAIYPHGFNGSLAVRVESIRVARRLAALGLKVTQRGDFETVFLFAPKDLRQVADMIQAQKRRQFSVEEKVNLIARLKGVGKRAGAANSKVVLVPEEGSSQGQERVS